MEKMHLSSDAIKNDQELGLPLIPIKDIFLDHGFNCRGHFAPSECVELAKDIARRGLQQPIVVRPLEETEDSVKFGFTHKVLAGHRRVTAYKILEADVIPAIVKQGHMTLFDEKDINAVENLQRAELNLEQEANAIRHYWMAGWNRQEIAERVGKSPGWVQIRVALLELPEEIQHLAGQGYIKTQDIQELKKYKSTQEQLKLAGMLRDRRKAGETQNVTHHIRKKDKGSTRKHRKPVQIFEFMNTIRETLQDVDLQGEPIRRDELITSQGNLFATRCLAWAAGEINTYEIHRELQDLCTILGIDYQLPEFEETF